MSAQVLGEVGKLGIIVLVIDVYPSLGTYLVSHPFLEPPPCQLLPSLWLFGCLSDALNDILLEHALDGFGSLYDLLMEGVGLAD